MQSAYFLFTSLILVPVLALLIGVMLVIQKRADSDVEPNRGGPTAYRYGDLMEFTYGGQVQRGEFKSIGPRIPGQPDPLRVCTIRIEWIDAQKRKCYSDIDMYCWQIRGKVRQSRKQVVVWDTAKLLKMDKWLLYGPPRKEQAR